MKAFRLEERNGRDRMVIDYRCPACDSVDQLLDAAEWPRRAEDRAVADISMELQCEKCGAEWKMSWVETLG